ncbi:N-ethylammeline chlorohydrolase [Bermanella sp. 47_1433_sub80_T6]|nr:N-ethylammeline chlorohydrolase [Bermanella sp. 47_1433_sub80_T6]
MSLAEETIITPKWVMTLESEELLVGHSVIIGKDVILAILPNEQALKTYPNAKHIFLPQQMLMPGFVNCHGHAAMNLFKGLADDLPLMTWLEEHIWPAEGQWVNEQFVADGTKLAISEMLLSGTTCFSDMYFFPEVVAEVSASMNMRAICYGPILNFPTPYGSGPDEYFDKILAAHDKFKHQPLIDIGFGPHAPYTVSDEPLKKVRMLSDQLKMPIQIHLHETEFEVSDALEKTGKRPSQRLDDLNFWGPDVQAVHVTQLNQQDIDIFKKAGTHVIHCPESNLKLASGFCPTHELQTAQINVALGTDGAASNNDLDMLSEMHSAALIAKAVSKDASALPALEAVKMATINGAIALGKEDQIGSIKVGKQADLISIDFSDISCAPMYDPISQLVYSASRHQVDHVWVAGHLQVKNKTLCHVDTAQLMEMAQEWADKISSKT